MFLAMRYYLALLGPFAIKPIQDVKKLPQLNRKTRAILAYLAATGVSYSRRTLWELFCQTAKDPAGSLRWHLSRIRRQLDAGILHVTAQEVTFNTAVAHTDLATFQETLSDPSGQPTEALAKAIDLYRGPFLDNLDLRHAPEFDLWLLAERTRIQQLYEKGGMVLVGHHIQQRQYHEAVSRAQALLQTNSLLETVHKQLVWLYAQTGQRDSALEQYERCRLLLQQELAVEPAPEMQALHTAVRHNQPLPPVVEASLPVPEMSSILPTKSDFVGRETELQQLRASWQNVRQTGGGTILIEAVAGGGKTRLVQEFFHTLPPGHASLRGNCYESTRTIPYQPWLAILETWLAHLKADEISQLAPPWRAQLGRLLPHVFLVTNGVPEQQEHLFRAVAELLLATRNTPPFLLVEDLQWADEASLQLFLFLAQYIRRTQSPALLLGTFRSEEVADNAALQTLLHDAWRDGKLARRLVLPPLAAGEVRVLIDLLRPDLPQDAPLTAIKNRLLAETGGNPLFITEILRELAQTADLPTLLPIPPSLQELTNRRLRRLPASSRQVLETLAVLDRPSPFELAQQISGRSEEETIHAIELGLRWHFLEPHQAGQYGFSHDLIGSAVRRQLSQIRRQRLHNRVANALTQRGADAAILAHHWGMAGNQEQEIHFALLAGEQALNRAAFGDAIHLFQKALAALPPAEKRRRFQATLGIVKAMEATSNVLELPKKLAALADLAEKIAAPAYRAESAQYQANFALVQGELDRAMEITTQGLEWAVAAGDKQREAGLLHVAGKAFRDQGEYATAQTYAERMLALYRATADKKGEVAALGLLGQLHEFQGQHLEASTVLKQALSLSRQLSDPFSTNRIVGILGGTLWNLGEFDEARAIMGDGLAVSREIGDKASEARHHNNLGGLATAVEDYETAVAHYRQALQIAESLQFSQGMALYYNNIGGAYVGLKDKDNALRHLEKAIAIAREAGLPRIEGAAYYTRGCAYRGKDNQAARLELEKSLTLRRELGEDFRLLLTLIELAEVCADLQDFDAVKAHLLDAIHLLESLHDQVPQFVHQKYHFAAYRLHTARQDHAAARNHLKQAHAALQQRFSEVDTATRQRLARLPQESAILAAVAGLNK